MSYFLQISTALVLAVGISGGAWAQGMIVNHNCTDISQVPEAWITTAKSDLHIAYAHTSHGSQITTGMTGLVPFMNGLGHPNDLYAWGNNVTGRLDLHDGFVSGDLGNPDRTTWASRTRTYLDDAANSDVNVVMWSWCGQAGTASQADITTYLTLMTALETDYPNISFVYMTGHLDGSGPTGNLNQRNEQIRNYCRTNNRILFDFADIESYAPDGAVNYMELMCNDACDYDSDGDGSRDKNWATDWQSSHSENTDWYDCSSAHSQPLNANRKAYAAWWMFARIAGWNSTQVADQWVVD